MSVTTHERFISYPAIFDSFVLNHIRSARPSPAIKKMMITPGGSIDLMAIAEVMREPTVDLESGDLGAVISGVGLTAGLQISSAAKIQYQQRADGGDFLGSGNHAILTAPKGFLYVEEISARQDAEEGASIKLKFHALRSGSNIPLTPTVGQSLTGSVAVNGLYRLSSVVYEGSILRGVQSVTFKTGLECAPKRDGGATCADVCSVVKRNPSIEISCTNISVAAAIVGLANISAGLSVYFEKIGASGSNHVSITISGGTYHFDGIDQQGQTDADVKIIVDLANASLSSSITAPLPS